MSNRLLLVDDEPLLLKLMTAVLKSAGYAVETAGTAEEVFKSMETGQFQFDMMVTDLKLPSFSGDQLAREVKRRFPETMVLLVSGYGAQPLPGVEYPMLGKPFRPSELVSRVGEMLGCQQASWPD